MKVFKRWPWLSRFDGSNDNTRSHLAHTGKAHAGCVLPQLRWQSSTGGEHGPQSFKKPKVGQFVDAGLMEGLAALLTAPRGEAALVLRLLVVCRNKKKPCAVGRLPLFDAATCARVDSSPESFPRDACCAEGGLGSGCSRLPRGCKGVEIRGPFAVHHNGAQHDTPKRMCMGRDCSIHFAFNAGGLPVACSYVHFHSAVSSVQATCQVLPVLWRWAWNGHGNRHSCNSQISHCCCVPPSEVPMQLN